MRRSRYKDINAVLFRRETVFDRLAVPPMAGPDTAILAEIPASTGSVQEPREDTSGKVPSTLISFGGKVEHGHARMRGIPRYVRVPARGQRKSPCRTTSQNVTDQENEERTAPSFRSRQRRSWRGLTQTGAISPYHQLSKSRYWPKIFH